MDQPRVRVMPMDKLNKMRGVAKRPLPVRHLRSIVICICTNAYWNFMQGPSEYKKYRAKSQILHQSPVSAFGGVLCEMDRDKTSKLSKTIGLSYQKPVSSCAAN